MARAQPQVGADRFGELLLAIAHHFLGFLSFADATRVGSLTITCRAFHLSNPKLYLSCFLQETTTRADKRLELFNSLDRFLIQRGDTRSKHFCFSMITFHDFGETEIQSHSGLEKSRLLGWIDDAIRRNVGKASCCVFILASLCCTWLRGDAEIDFPFCVFLCDSLREGFTPSPLCNVSTLHLCIQRSIDDNLLPAMTSLFRDVPNLTTLEVSSYPWAHLLDDSDDNVSGFDRGYWELQKLDFVSKLEQVAIEFARGSNGFELASYRLEYARNLKKLPVITIVDQLSPVTDMLRSNPTSIARVVFVDKEEHFRSRV